MTELESDIKSIKLDCRIIRVLLFIFLGSFIGCFIGYICGSRSAKPKTEKAGYCTRHNGNYNTLDNPADRGSDKTPATSDSIAAFLNGGAVLQAD